MYKLVKKEKLNINTYKLVIEAPLIAKKAKAGQFIIIRGGEECERIPLTINNADKASGNITVIVQALGMSTVKLSMIEEGEYILDVTGPLGRPTELVGIKKAAVVCGGLGAAISYPQARALHENGAEVDIIAGFRNKELIILQNELGAVGKNLYICTDDGSAGEKGVVTDKLRSLIDSGSRYDVVFAVGPAVMMKFVSLLTKEYEIKTIVSLNPIMVDGTGMCGCCRVNVGGKIKFACVDGPDFDGHLVDFDSLIKRLRSYSEEERVCMDHICKIGLDK